jgi:preprotein translocase subunit SecD
MSASKSLTRLLVLCIALIRVVCASDSTDRPGMGVEFRRAEVEPADSLTQATVQGSGQKIYLHKDADLTSADVAVARVVKADVLGDRKETFSVDVQFTKQGANRMAVLSQEHHGKPLAILFDGKVISAPLIMSPLSETVVIAGGFTDAEAKRLADALNQKGL